MSRRHSFLFVFSFLFCNTGLAKETHFGQVFPKYPKAKKVTSKGSSRHPIFISNSSFIFVSKNRSGHKDSQLYFFDLNKKKEKRITHQRGQVTNGSYQRQSGQIYYSSSTDEEKETPFILKKYIQRFPSSVKNDSFFQVDFAPQELYKSPIDGSAVERLTHNPGYDGFPIYNNTKHALYFSRWQNNQLSLFTQPIPGNSIGAKTPRKLTKTLGHDLGLQLSPQGNAFVWTRFSPDFATSQILTASLDFKNPQFVTLESGWNWSPVWHPNGSSLIYSARSANQRDFDLYEVSLNEGCKRQLTSFQGDEFLPSISPNGQTILFTSTLSGSEQVYQMPYPEPLKCETRKN